MTAVVSPFDLSAAASDTRTALKFITCGSVDDGKSTLIGRLLVDSKAVLQDHLAGVQRHGETDLALLTDGLSAEREQGITIDVAYRYFNTERRKFIIGDAPGHEQYTRNMVTAASAADAAVVLVDATKLAWQEAGFDLLPQTRRHALLLQLLRVPSIVFAINKLDAVADSALAFQRIGAALAAFASAAGIGIQATVPVSALKGWNVVDSAAGWCGYSGPTLLALLEGLPVTPPDVGLPLAFPVQWVEKPGAELASAPEVSSARLESDRASADLPAGQARPAAGQALGRRVFWGRVATGSVRAGQWIKVMPSGQSAQVAMVLDAVRQPRPVQAGHSAGLLLDRELDVSRGDWLLSADAAADTAAGAADDAGAGETTGAASLALTGSREIRATVAWLDDEPLLAGRTYWALHGHRWVKARVRRVVHRLDINTLAEEPATQLEPNGIGHIELALQEPLVTLPFLLSRALGSMVLVDTASHRTSGALLVL